MTNNIESVRTTFYLQSCNCNRTFGDHLCPLHAEEQEEVTFDTILSSITTNYFTPDFFDLRPGYECEIRFNGVKEEFKPTVITPDFIDYYCKHEHLIEERIRVAYLNRELIEKEGWKSVNDCDVTFKKGHHILIHYPSHNKIEIRDRKNVSFTQTNFFLGTCKDINTLRLISKLLNI